MRAILDDRPMSALQIAAVAITIALNALDGFDVLAISFASPGIMTEWGIDRAALGIVLSMELIGMAIGSILLGGVADRIGRRPTILGCLVVMAGGMAAATTSSNVVELSAWRVTTGLGIGGMIASLNALTAEYANARWRRLAVSLMVIGYPIGVVAGGSVAALLLRGGDWRAVFQFGAIVTAVCIPLVAFFVPESIAHLASRQPRNALEKINRILARMRHPPINQLPAVQATARVPLAALFSPALAVTTLLVTIGYFAHITVFYYVAKWLPQIVVDMGFAPSAGAGVLVWMSAGGAIGGAIFGVLAQLFGLKPMTVLALVATTAMLVVFGRGSADLASLSVVAAFTGVCIQSGIVGLYGIFAEAFPTHVRAAGTGFVIGAGRAGALLSPMIAGFLFNAGLGLQFVSILIGVASLLAALMIASLKLGGAAGARAAPAPSDQAA
jgi:benzoate transport